MFQGIFQRPQNFWDLLHEGTQYEKQEPDFAQWSNLYRVYLMFAVANLVKVHDVAVAWTGNF